LLSQRGVHQLSRPSSAIVDGTSSMRTTVASSATASAMPKPSALTNTTGAAANALNTTIMSAAALVTRRPVRVTP